MARRSKALEYDPRFKPIESKGEWVGFKYRSPSVPEAVTIPIADIRQMYNKWKRRPQKKVVVPGHEILYSVLEGLRYSMRPKNPKLARYKVADERGNRVTAYRMNAKGQGLAGGKNARWPTTFDRKRACWTPAAAWKAFLKQAEEASADSYKYSEQAKASLFAAKRALKLAK